MGQKLHGMLNLSRIPKEMLVKNKNGETCVWIDVNPLKNGADQYGNTHNIAIYDKENRQNIYLANLKPQEFGGAQPSEQTPQEQTASTTEALMGDMNEALARKRAQNDTAVPEGMDKLPF